MCSAPGSGGLARRRRYTGAPTGLRGRAGHRPDRPARRPRPPVRRPEPQPEPTAVRSALCGGGLLVLTGLLLLLVVLSTWIGTEDTTLGQVWTALWNDGP
ncbi:hypothetical protein [Streptomyces sp. NPDC045714]|uniref:hypothetical protein n=1 Tax=Streptomyces sp. NPDC045714 TaxID=3154913 RepID=UPI0033C93A9F